MQGESRTLSPCLCSKAKAIIATLPFRSHQMESLHDCFLPKISKHFILNYEDEYQELELQTYGLLMIHDAIFTLSSFLFIFISLQYHICYSSKPHFFSYFLSILGLRTTICHCMIFSMLYGSLLDLSNIFQQYLIIFGKKMHLFWHNYYFIDFLISFFENLRTFSPLSTFT